MKDNTAIKSIRSRFSQAFLSMLVKILLIYTLRLILILYLPLHFRIIG